MKIGDVVYVRGTVDEIRKDVVIIRNKGGYFGTVPEEIQAYIGDYTDFGDFSDILWLNSRNRAFYEVLEAIDRLAEKEIIGSTDKAVGFDEAIDDLREAVEALKGGEQ